MRMISGWTTLIMAAAISGAAWADGPAAPSRLRRYCEEVLIQTGLFRPLTRAKIRDGGYEVHLIGSHVIGVRLAHQNRIYAYNFTNRDIYELRRQQLYPSNFLDPVKLQGKSVLDLATGEGLLVEDLRRAGVNALGLDIFLTPYTRSKPYFVQASMDETPFASRSFDVVMSSMGPIRYFPEDRAFMQRILREAHRILKTGGVFRFTPLDLADVSPFERQPDETALSFEVRTRTYFAHHGAHPSLDLARTGLWPLPPGLRVKSAPSADWFFRTSLDCETNGPYYWLELERYD